MDQAKAFSRRAAPEFCSTKTKSSGPDRVGRRRRWYRHPSRSHPAHRSGRRNADRRVNLPAASADAAARPDLSSLSRVRGGREGRARLSAFHRGACGSEPTPPLSSSTRFLGRGRHQALDRSWCRQGVFPEPPENGSDEPPPAGTALAPAAGVTQLPSCKLSEIRDVRIRNGDECQ